MSTVKVKSLSIQEISIAMRACSLNAEELIQEAALLSSAGHRARAFFLYCTACEEFAKFFIFEAAGKRTAKGDPPDWKRFWKRLRSHDSKLAHIEVRSRQMSVINDAPENFGLAVSALDLLSNYGALPRNTSLYVDLDPGGAFRRPSEIDWIAILPSLEAQVKHLLRLAKRSGETIGEIEQTLHQPPTDKAREQTRNTLMDVIAQMKAAGMSKVEVIQALGKTMEPRQNRADKSP